MRNEMANQSIWFSHNLQFEDMLVYDIYQHNGKTFGCVDVLGINYMAMYDEMGDVWEVIG